MRKDFGKHTWMVPMPVLILCSRNEDGTANAMNAAWGGIHDTNQIGICISETHRSTQNILREKVFTVSMGDACNVNGCDYVGLVSGNKDEDKLAKAGFTVSRASMVDAPVINELPMALECKLVSYDTESGYLVADIVNVSMDESALGEDGKPDYSRFSPLIFDTIAMGYYTLGTRVGNAFADGKKLI